MIVKRLICLAVAVGFTALCASAQLTLPRESTRQEITQVVGDGKISISYSRPNSKGRKLWGCTSADVVPKGGVTYDCLVPNGQVWRTGANEATVFETSVDLMVNGQKLPKGKYGLFSIPGDDAWVIIFSKTWNQWGSFSYDAKDDQLRVTSKPAAGEMFETMSITIDDITATSANVEIRWEKVVVPFKIDVGDVNARLIDDVRRRMSSEPAQLANYVIGQKLSSRYEEVLALVEEAIKTRETFQNVSAKARLLAEMGRTKEAITVGERAVQIGKAMTPPANTAGLERAIADWKAKN